MTHDNHIIDTRGRQHAVDDDGIQYPGRYLAKSAAPSDEDVASAVKFLTANAVPVKSQLGSSYCLKHEMESRSDGCYVSNGSFIVAAFRLGYRIRVVTNSPNPDIYLKIKTL